MSSTNTHFTEERQHKAYQGPVGTDYIPTEEERKVFHECNRESFWYRSVPFSVVGIAITQALITKGTLSASPRFGSLPKVAFAGFCGYLAGKMSYVKTCQEKFKNLENSPLGEALKQRSGLPPPYSSGPQPELSNPDMSVQSLDMFQQDPQSQVPSHSRDYGFSPEPPMQMEREDDLNSPGQIQQYVAEEEPRRKPILYEDLRLKNRENYEVTLTQKTETLMKPPPQRESERPKKNAKNIYGDSWEE